MTTDSLDEGAESRRVDPRPGHGAGAFVSAVVAQLSRAIDQAGAGAQQQVDWLTDRLTSLLLACEQGEAEPALQMLVDDPLLLSSVFQNIDLLFAADYPFADDLSMLTLDAVHRAVEREGE